MNDLLVEIDLSYIAEKRELPSYLKNVFYSDNGSQYICLISRITNIGSLRKKHKFDQNWHDSKVLIELYRKIGNKFVDELIGGFTIIILDTSNMFSLIFRDHFGLLPAYFCCNKNKLILSSSLKNILKKYPEQKKISNQSVIDLILFMGTEHDKTFFRNVRQIPKGHFLFYSKDRLQLFKHYNFNKIKKLIYKNEDEYFDQFKYLFENAVSRQLSFCGENASFSLSGGLDSSSILCVAKNINNKSDIKKNISSYSIILEGLKGKEANAAFETDYIDEVTLSTGIINNKIKVLNTGPLSNLSYFSKYFSQPIRSPNYYVNMQIYSKLNQANIKHHFEGFDGDDIVSHGYERLKQLGLSFNFFELIRQERKLRERRNLKYSLLNSIRKNILGPFLVKTKVKQLKDRLTNITPMHVGWSQICNKSFLNQIDLNEKLNKIWGANPYEFNDPLKAHEFSVFNHNKEYGVEMLREMGQKYGVEIMLPFFDRELIEFCLNAPLKLKLNDGYDRYIFRKSMSGIVPQKILKRTSKGDISAFALKEMLSIDKVRLEDNFFNSDSYLSSILNRNFFLAKFDDLLVKKDLRYLTNLFQIISLNQWLNDNM